MKIALFTHYFHPHVGGIEVVARNHAEHLAKRGHDVTVVTTAIDATQRQESRDGYNVVRYSASNPLEQRGIPYPFPNPLDAVRTSRAVVDDDTDLMHIHGLNYLTSLVPLIGVRSQDIPVIVHQHTPFIRYSPAVDLIQKANDNLVGRGVLQYADRTIAVSENIADYVSSLGTEQVTTHYNGVDTDRFRPDLCQTRGEILYVGRLTQKKGVDKLLRAAKILDTRSSPVTVRIVGKGDMTDQVEAVASSLETVEYDGFVPSEKLPEIYSQAAGLLVPRAGGDAFPTLTMLEALASGTPPILTHRPSSTDGFVEDNTYLYADSDPRDLANVCEQVALDLETTDEMAASTRQAAVEVFDWRSRIDELESIYRTVLAQ